MLVSSIARFEAINTMNNAMFQSMQASNNMMNMIGDSRTFGSIHDMNMLHELDNRFSITIATNSLLYKLAYLQEKMFSKMQAEEFARNKKAIDYKA